MGARVLRRRIGWLGTALLIALLLVPATRAEAQSVSEALKAVRAEKDPEKRAALVPKIALLGGDSAARALAWLLRADLDVGVRIAAARGLGEVKAENIRTVLLKELRYGGILPVRQALADAIRRQDLGAGLIRSAAYRGASALERPLVVEAMGLLTDEVTRAELHRLARAKRSDLRAVAIRAAAVRTDAAHARLRLFLELLMVAREKDVLLTTLDAIQPFVHATMRPALKRLAKHRDVDVRDAADHALRWLRYTEVIAAIEAQKAAEEAAKKKPEDEADTKDDRYAKPERDVPVPDEDDTPDARRPKRPRQDIVWVLDVTGSTGPILGAKKARLLQQVASLSGERLSTRLGVVIFRGGHSIRDRQQGISVVPLTFDHERVARYIAELESRGTDDRGSAIPMAVHTALDQMAWRSRARREVRLDLDGGCARPGAAKATIARHFAYGTKSFVTYTLRSRRRVPEEVDAFAELGGTRGARILP